MCEYKFSDGEICKEEALLNSKYCILHIDLPEGKESEEFKRIKELKEEKVKEKVDKGDFNFEGAKLLEIDFSKMQIERDVNFNDVVVIQSASFGKAKIGGDASFEKTKFEKLVDFSDAEFGNEASFRGATFGNGARFKGATFGNEASFRDAKFNKTASFGDATFGNGANFHDAKFGNWANFHDAKFGNDASFKGAKFGNDAGFWSAEFGNGASFLGAKFGNGASFWDATFGNGASFRRAKFGNGASFSEATFGIKAHFRDAEFGNEASFWSAEFGNEASFRGVKFHSVKFIGAENKIFKASVNFSYSVFEQPENTEFVNANLSKASFLHCQGIEKISRFEKVEWALKGKFFKRKSIHDEITVGETDEGEDKHYEYVAEVYRKLRLNYERNLRFPEAGDFYIGEMEMKRRNAKLFGIKIKNRILNFIIRNTSLIAWYRNFSYYCENYCLPLLWIFAIIFIFFPFLLSTDPLTSAQIFFQSPPGDLNEKVSDLVICTFTLSSKWFVLLERILSIVFIALFVLALRRKFKKTNE